MSPLKGRIALVTGAGRGIGKGIALTLAAHGAHVVCAARTESELLEVADRIQREGGSASAIRADVTVERDVRQLVASGLQDRLDILVLNAGRGMGEDKSVVKDSDPAVWRDILECNLVGAYLCAREAIPYLLESDAGKIIMIGSGARLRRSPRLSAYAAAKSGLWALTLSLAEELKADHVAVNEIIPGPVHKEHMLTPAKLAEIEAGAIELSDGEWHKTPMDLAGLVMFLASQPALGPTGQSFSLLRH